MNTFTIQRAVPVPPATTVTLTLTVPQLRAVQKAYEDAPIARIALPGCESYALHQFLKAALAAAQ